MKLSNLLAFEKHLESSHPNHFSPVYLIRSGDDYLTRSSIASLKKWVGKDENKTEFHSIDAESNPTQSLSDIFYAPSLFATHKIIVICSIDRAKASIKTSMEEILNSPPPNVTIILVAQKLAANTRIYKRAEKAGVVVDFLEKESPRDKEARIKQWIIRTLNNENKKISPQAATDLVEQVGTDMALLANELEKLCCYVGECGEITSCDIQKLCPIVKHENVWQLGKAIFSLQAKSALTIALGLLSNNTPLIVLMRQIRKQLETDYQVLSIIESGSDFGLISELFPYMKGRILQEHVDLARQYGLKRFRRGIVEIDKAEVQMKNSDIKEDLLLERLIITLTK